MNSSQLAIWMRKCHLPEGPSSEHVRQISLIWPTPMASWSSSSSCHPRRSLARWCVCLSYRRLLFWRIARFRSRSMASCWKGFRAVHHRVRCMPLHACCTARHALTVWLHALKSGFVWFQRHHLQPVLACRAGGLHLALCSLAFGTLLVLILRAGEYLEVSSAPSECPTAQRPPCGRRRCASRGVHEVHHLSTSQTLHPLCARYVEVTGVAGIGCGVLAGSIAMASFSPGLGSELDASDLRWVLCGFMTLAVRLVGREPRQRIFRIGVDHVRLPACEVHPAVAL